MTLLKGLSWLVVGRSVSDGLALLFYIVLARTFGEAGLGDYAFAFAVALVLGTGIGFGFRPLITRDLARRPALTPDYAGRILVIQTGLAAAIGILILAPLIVVGGYSLELKALLVLAFLAVALEAIGSTFVSCLEAAEAFNRSATLEIIMKTIAITTGLALLGLGAPIQVVMLAHVVGGVGYLITGIYWVTKRFGFLQCRPDWRFAQEKLSQAFPFGGQSGLYLLHTRLDAMLLHSMVGDVETGRYAGAMRLTTAPLMLAAMIGIAIYPRMSRSGADATEQRALFLSALKWLSLLGIAGAVTLLIVGDDLLVLALGNDFVQAAALMPWMAVIFFLGFARVAYQRLLFATNRERYALYIEIGAVTINVVLNLLLIPRWGAHGAVWALITSQTFVLGALHVCGRRLVAARYGVQATRLVLAGIAGLVGAMALQQAGAWLAAVALTPAIVFATAMLLGLITTEDREMLRASIPWRT